MTPHLPRYRHFFPLIFIAVTVFNCFRHVVPLSSDKPLFNMPDLVPTSVYGARRLGVFLGLDI